MPTLAEVSRSRMLESLYDRFEAAWQSGEEPDIDEFAVELKEDLQRRQALHELVLIDLEYRWRRAPQTADLTPAAKPLPFAAEGRPLLEDYVERWPEFGPVDRLPVAAIVHEFRVRCETGDTPELAEYSCRFPVQSRGLHDALQQEVEEQLHSTKSVAPTRPTDSASTGPEEPRPRDASRRLTPGDQLGRYRILWPVGRGAMGTVYLAYDPDLDRQIAIKVPFLDGPHAERLTQRFRREAKLTASLRHPNICRVLDVDRLDGIDFLTMDFVDGTSLETLIKSGPLMPPVQAAQIVRKIATALQEAHAAGVIHRDVKPSNILIDRRGEPVLTDFGLARRPEADESEQTRPGEWLGTPAYMAPEQFSGNADNVTPGCDIFSLGVVLYRLLTGQRPFGDGHRHDEISNRKPPAMPHLLRTGLAKSLSEICLRAIQFDPSKRFSSAGEFAAALEPYTNDVPVEPSRHSSTVMSSAPRPTIRRHVMRLSLTPVMAVLAAIVSGYATWSVMRDDTPRIIPPPPSNVASSAPQDAALKLLPRVELHVQRASQTEGYQVLGPELGALKDGDKMQFHVVLDEPAFVALFYVDADGLVSRRTPVAGQDASHPVKEVWDPPLANAGQLQEMHVLGDKAGIELIVAVTSPTPFAESTLATIERLRLTPISSPAGFSFVARRETAADDSSDTVRLTTLPLGANPHQFALTASNTTRAISGKTLATKVEAIDWEQFAEHLARLGEFCHGSAFLHVP